MSSLIERSKPLLKSVARSTVGRLPPSPARLTGALARHGGAPVRDVRFRPWASGLEGAQETWRAQVSRMFRDIYVSGVEGLPQPLAKEFATQWAAFCGCRHALLVPHGTDALRLALAAALNHDGLEYGGEVIVPNYSFIASATAALDRRFGIALADVDPETLLLDPSSVETAIVPGRTRAIMPVHLFGQPGDMTALRGIADRHGLRIIEDAAQAHGSATIDGPSGSLGHAAAFSFQSSKILSCGEGGALTTNDEQLFERAYAMHNAGRSPSDPARWEHLSLGWNCRVTEYQAALLIHRMKHFPRQQAVRASNFQRLRNLLGGVEAVEPVPVAEGVARHGMYMFALRYRTAACRGLDVDEFVDLVRAEGAPVSRAFTATLSEQPALQSVAQRHPDYVRRLPTPHADQAARDTLFIPHEVFLGPASDMDDIAAAIHKVEMYCRKSVTQAAR